MREPLILMFGAAAVLSLALTVRLSSLTLPAQTAAPAQATPDGRMYVGSKTCRRCHTGTYDRWSKTRMANVVTDPRTRPEVILPDLSKPDPLLTFTIDDIAFVYGSKWKQRYFTKVGDDYYPLPAQWDVTNRVWRPYFVQPNTDWWVPHYPADNKQRPTGPLCDGCHSVNYNIRPRRPSWSGTSDASNATVLAASTPPDRQPPTSSIRPSSISCAPTIPASSATRRAAADEIRSKAVTTTGQWDSIKASSSRTSGKLEEHKLGETTFTHFADGTGHKNRMQGNDFVTEPDVPARRHLFQLP